MSARVKKHWDYIHLLANTSSTQQRKALLDTITKEQFKAVSEIILNVAHLKIPVSKSSISKLSRHKKTIELLVNKQVGAHHRLNAVKKNSKLVVTLLQAALPGLKTILS